MLLGLKVIVLCQWLNWGWIIEIQIRDDQRGELLITAVCKLLFRFGTLCSALCHDLIVAEMQMDMFVAIRAPRLSFLRHFE